MAHPKRAEFIPYLLEKLGKDTPVIWDQKNNLWDTCRRAWLAQDFTCEYSLVIQDDCIITDNFREKAENILQSNYIYSFYAGGQMSALIHRAEKRKENFVIHKMIYNEPALCMRTEHIKHMVQYCDLKQAVNDHFIAQWAKQKGIKIYYPLPSLVDHRDTKSIYKENYNLEDTGRIRKALRFNQK